jgi:hypothetical protein
MRFIERWPARTQPWLARSREFDEARTFGDGPIRLVDLPVYSWQTRIGTDRELTLKSGVEVFPRKSAQSQWAVALPRLSLPPHSKRCVFKDRKCSFQRNLPLYLVFDML